MCLCKNLFIVQEIHCGSFVASVSLSTPVPGVPGVRDRLAVCFVDDAKFNLVAKTPS